MQKIRLRESTPAKILSGENLKGPPEYWENLGKTDVDTVCRNAPAKKHSPNGLLLPFLNEYLLVDWRKRGLYRRGHHGWEVVDRPLLELVCLVYLLNATHSPITHKTISVQEFSPFLPGGPMS